MLHHHERLDGGGYPDRLLPPSISPWARIAAICDAYDAMTTDRPYAPAMTAIDALKIISVRGKTAYDQDLVKIFVRSLLDTGNAPSP